MRAILRGRIVIENAGRLLDNAGILVDNGEIIRVGSFDELKSDSEQLPVREYDGIICPALINAHTHLELSWMRMFHHTDFVDWVLKLVDTRAARPPEETLDECVAAKRKAEASGTAFFVNVGNSHEVNTSLGANQLFEYEQIGINSSGADSIVERAIEKIRGSSEVATALAIHAPYSVSPELMRKIKFANDAAGTLTSLHLAETPEEDEFVRTGQGRMRDLLDTRVGKWSFRRAGVSPVRYVDSLGILDEKTICVHCVFVDDDDIAILRDRKSAVSICVRSNRELSGKIPPVERLAKNGVRLLIGTDSTASSPSINMLDEVASFYHEYRSCFEPAQVFALATSSAADFLGVASKYGSISAGRASAMVFLPYKGDRSEAVEFVLSEGHNYAGMIYD